MEVEMSQKNNAILGFCSGHDSSAFVVEIDSGEVVFAVEERWQICMIILSPRPYK